MVVNASVGNSGMPVRCRVALRVRPTGRGGGGVRAAKNFVQGRLSLLRKGAKISPGEILVDQLHVSPPLQRDCVF